MISKKIFSLFLIFGLWLLLSLFHGESRAALFGNNVPEGKEIKDPYIEQLFAPEFPYDSIKVIETKEGKRYVVAKAKEKVTEKSRLNYEKNTLRNRGVVVFREGSPRTNILMISEMRLYRVVSEMPYVVEYCEVKADKLEREAENVVKNEGKYLVVLINKNFGKVFKKVEIYPEKETSCPAPPFVGKYPNSRCVSCTGGEKGSLFVYVTKDKGQEIYSYYKDKLKAHYVSIGFNFPEKAWKFDDEFGIQIKSSEVAKVGSLLEHLSKKPSTSTLPSTNGVVFHIVITQIELNPVIKDFSFISIFYCTDPERINMDIERMKKLYPEGMK